MEAASGNGLMAGVGGSALDGAASASDPPAGAGVASASIRALFGVLFAVLVGYVVSLFVRPVSDSHVWLDGWGVSGFELLASVLIVARGLVDRRARRYAVAHWLGGMLMGTGGFREHLHGCARRAPGEPGVVQLLLGWVFPACVCGPDGVDASRCDQDHGCELSRRSAAAAGVLGRVDRILVHGDPACGWRGHSDGRDQSRLPGLGRAGVRSHTGRDCAVAGRQALALVPARCSRGRERDRRLRCRVPATSWRAPGQPC